MIKAIWKPGLESLHKGCNAQLVAEEVMAIGDSATPQQILDKARDKTTELHKCFEWDNAVAAEKYRLQQARTIMCHLVIEDDKPEDERPVVRYFYNIGTSEGYKPTAVIIKNLDEYGALLEQAKRDLKAFEKKYHGLTELQEVFDLIALIA